MIHRTRIAVGSLALGIFIVTMSSASAQDAGPDGILLQPDIALTERMTAVEDFQQFSGRHDGTRTRSPCVRLSLHLCGLCNVGLCGDGCSLIAPWGCEMAARGEGYFAMQFCLQLVRHRKAAHD